MDRQSNSTTAPFVSIGEASLSLTEAIRRYREDWSTYLEASRTDDDAPRGYEDPARLLAAWDKPASSRVEAVHALEQAVIELDIGETPLIRPMVTAALGFLKVGDCDPISGRTSEATPMPTIDLSDIFYDLGDLSGLIQSISDVLHEMSYAREDGSRNNELDRVASLQRVACREIKRLHDAATVFDGPREWVRVQDVDGGGRC